MSVFIVDASVAAKWFIEEEYNEAALSVLDESNQLHAPEFLLLEMDSIICKWIRRDVVTPAEGSDMRDALRQYPIQHHPFVSFLDSGFAIANQTGQSVYDCLYVALAALLKGRMVTADRRLYDAMNNGPFKKHVVWVGDVG
ncbi:MAG: type II toxin-antitoxin system VapC family toxin [Deltaproteobacteria bacterium]